ncbi:hypothetical protein ACIBH1_22155 [Nonomuraea sp. NPDC050663]|uniref:Uncharacterized protein n=1 Tax=Nonomuraea soli TaxID=1032476 RepID=A0A7W0CPD6_9ACTN|nr:hypothetical protein [Nonomuraea soli]MBA2894840.1 hypothetical protein [Nonomuraea soli]NUT44136.1 hypothetical protein [Thermoactinospora sp.]
MRQSIKRYVLAPAAAAALLTVAVPSATAGAGSESVAKPGAAVTTFNDPSCWKNVVNDVKGAATKAGLNEWWRTKYTFAASNSSVQVFVTFFPTGDTSSLGFRPTAYAVYASADTSDSAKYYRDRVKANILAIQYIDYC